MAGIVLGVTRAPDQSYEDLYRARVGLLPQEGPCRLRGTRDDALLLGSQESAAAGRKGTRLQLRVSGREARMRSVPQASRSTSGPRKTSTASRPSSSPFATLRVPKGRKLDKEIRAGSREEAGSQERQEAARQRRRNPQRDPAQAGAVASWSRSPRCDSSASTSPGQGSRTMQQGPVEDRRAACRRPACWAAIAWNLPVSMTLARPSCSGCGTRRIRTSLARS